MRRVSTARSSDGRLVLRIVGHEKTEDETTFDPWDQNEEGHPEDQDEDD